MLYVTTRDKADAYTAHRVLHEGEASNGGQFLPMRIPRLSQEELADLRGMSFNEAVASVLNRFFTVRLTGWDIEFAIGRKAVRLADIGRKVTVAELWRNTEGDYKIAARRIYARLCDDIGAQKDPAGWSSIAIRLAFLFGLYVELTKQGIESFDAAASGKNMEQVITLCYARDMGLPIGRIICGTNENCWAWDLIHKGEVSSTGPVKTDTPDLDVFPAGIERLIYGTLGPEETQRYIQCISTNNTYAVADDQLRILNAGLFSSVIGRRRVSDLVASVYSTERYVIDPYSAISYGALQDYRAKTGENRQTIVLSEKNPAHFCDIICRATGLSEEDIKKK